MHFQNLTSAILALSLLSAGCGRAPDARGVAPKLGKADGAQAAFIRGDADGNGKIELADAIAIAFYIYESDALNCDDAADANDDGVINLSDVIAVASPMYIAPSPHGVPGPDPTPDGLGCEFYDATSDPWAVNPRMIVRDADVLTKGGLTFDAVMKQLADSSPDPYDTPLSLYQQWWTDLGGPSCPPTINGFPNNCSRIESILGSTDPFAPGPSPELMDSPTDHAYASYLPVAAINRFDLADDNYKNCGQYRLIFALKQGNDLSKRNFIIFEAVAPNPGQGMAGCRRLLHAWNKLACSESSRGKILKRIFLDGIGNQPPLISFANFSSGQGQIRTSSRFEPLNTWMFRQFTTTMENGSAKIRQEGVDGTVYFPLLAWAATGGQAATLASIDSLAGSTFSTVGLGELGTPAFRAPFSEADEVGAAEAWHWVTGQFGAPAPAAFVANVEAAANAHGLTARNIYDRITAKTCAGCHAKWLGKDLGGGVRTPRAFMVQHVTEGGQLSPHMRTIALPRRRAHWDKTVGPGRCR